MKKYKLLWYKSLKTYIRRFVLSADDWKDYFITEEYKFNIMGVLLFFIFLVSISPITFIVSIICTIIDVNYARRQIKAGNQTFIDNALKYKLIKVKGEKK